MLADELRALEAKDPQPAEAGVAFTGPFDLVYETNLRSRVASRILWRVATFAYKTPDDIYAQAKEVRWREHFSAERTFKIETNAHRSPVKSLDFVTLRVEDAIAWAREVLARYANDPPHGGGGSLSSGGGGE